MIRTKAGEKKIIVKDFGNIIEVEMGELLK